jgi:transposase
MSSDFEALYSRLGRPGIAPGRLLRALLLQCFYSVRSERQLMERLEFDLLFRWFVGLGVDDPVWDASVFSKNRDRLLAGEVAQRFLAELLALPEVRRLLSSEHFSVDGTLIQAWASLKSFRRKDGGDEPPGPGRNGERSSGARSGRTRPMPAPPTRTRGSTARATASLPSSATSGTP